MARIYRKSWTKRLPDGSKEKTRSRAWYVDYRDVASDTVKTVKGYTDRKATEQRAAELERTSERTAVGLIDRFAEHRKRPLTEHVHDFHRALLAKECTEKQADLLMSRCLRVLDECRFRFWPEISASSVQASIAELKIRRKGKTSNDPTLPVSVQTKNFYLAALKQFCRWIVRDGRAPENPLAHLQGGNVRTDRRHDRRALEPDELRRLLSVTETGTTRYSLTGPDRVALYRLAVETGLRASELRSLTWNDLNFAGAEPTVTVRAAYAKNRREDSLPLKLSTAQSLRVWRDKQVGVDRMDPVFPTMPAKGHVAEMVRADLDDSGIVYRDDAGRVVDFHALRHTFINNLVRGGVQPKVAQTLARHSTITLTMDRYSHTNRGQLTDALSALPDLSLEPCEKEVALATGTDNRIIESRAQKSMPENLPSALPFHMPEQGSPNASSIASTCTLSNELPKSKRAENPGKIGVSRTPSHRVASQKNRRRRDSNPRYGYPHNGFQNRPLQPLGHSSVSQTCPVVMIHEPPTRARLLPRRGRRVAMSCHQGRSFSVTGTGQDKVVNPPKWRAR